MQDIKRCKRMFYNPYSRYTHPFLALRVLELQGFLSDARELLEKVEKVNAQEKGQHIHETTWACLDAAVWLAKCIRELDSQMDLVDEESRHPWTKDGLCVYKYALASMCIQTLCDQLCNSAFHINNVSYKTRLCIAKLFRHTCVFFLVC